MCGVFGIYFFNPERRVEEPLLKRMGDSIHSRGPDDFGYFTRRNIGLGMRRLSIIDVTGGKQPVSDEHNRIHAVLNGELYNFNELKQQYLGGTQGAHTFRSNSDAEIIPHLYEVFGEDFVEKLNGMFAISLWDSNREKLVLYRDRLGIKPLYYYLDDEMFIWASELKAILATGLIEPEINPEAVALYFRYGYVPSPLSIFKKLQKLPAGCCLEIDTTPSIDNTGNKTKLRPYWEINGPVFTGNITDAKEQLSLLLKQSVKYRLISDVPLGAFLSGGLDSSLIVGLMSHVMEQPVKTFSVRFQEKEYDESAYAGKVADKFATVHHPFDVKPLPMDIVDVILPYFDEPFADQSSVPAFYVSQQARQHVTVALSGDGGDELFGGYKKYRTLKSAALYQRFKPLSMAIANIGKRLPGKPGRRAANFARYGRMEPNRRFLEMAAIMNEETIGDILTNFVNLPGQRSDPFVNLTGTVDSFEMGLNTEMNRWLKLDILTYLVDDVLTKVDRMSMFHSLEVRVPLLDHRIVEFACSLPASYKLHYFQGKHILKNIGQNLLPHDIVYRSKHAWNVPVKNWLRNELKPAFSDMLSDTANFPKEILDIEAVRKLADEHFREECNHGHALWNVMAFIIWYRHWGRTFKTIPK